MNTKSKRYESLGRHRLETRSMESLLGICMGMMADNYINNDEIVFLQCWLEEHQNIADQFPADILSANIKEILEDGEVSDNERTQLIELIKSIIGGTAQESGATSGFSTKLPIDTSAKVKIPGKTFCFTGVFNYGSRKYCETAIKEAGGTIKKNVVADLDYLVLGDIATKSWAATSFGRKIELAVSYQNKHVNIKIVSEEQWINAQID